MSDHHIIKALGIASALALGVATQASASPILGIELIESGFATFSTTSSADPLIVSQSFGTFKTNVEVNNLETDPLSMDLSSTNVSTSTAGTLTIIASATGLTSPLGLSQLFSQFSGNYSGAVTSATFQTYVSNSNTMFGMDTLLASLTGTGTPFATSADSSVTTNDPFAITEVLTISTTGQATISFDGSIAAPEIDAGTGGAAIALLLGALGLVGERRRRPEATA